MYNSLNDHLDVHALISVQNLSLSLRFWYPYYISMCSNTRNWTFLCMQLTFCQVIPVHFILPEIWTFIPNCQNSSSSRKTGNTGHAMLVNGDGLPKNSSLTALHGVIFNGSWKIWNMSDFPHSVNYSCMNEYGRNSPARMSSPFWALFGLYCGGGCVGSCKQRHIPLPFT